MKIGRRGSLSATLRVFGRQGHVAYPHLADNPLRPLVAVLARLMGLKLDEGNAAFSPSNLEVVSVDVGNAAFNVIPAEASARINVRFNDNWTVPSLTAFLEQEATAVLRGHRFALTVAPGASESFLTRSEALVGRLGEAIAAVTGLDPELSTGGGTSDARFFRAVCPVVEFGLVGDTMHQVDERVPLADLDGLVRVYRTFLERYFA